MTDESNERPVFWALASVSVVMMAFCLGGAMVAWLLRAAVERHVQDADNQVTACQFELGQATAMELLCRKLVTKLADDCAGNAPEPEPAPMPTPGQEVPPSSSEPPTDASPPARKFTL